MTWYLQLPDDEFGLPRPSEAPNSPRSAQTAMQTLAAGLLTGGDQCPEQMAEQLQERFAGCLARFGSGTPAVQECWAAMLDAVPNSALWRLRVDSLCALTLHTLFVSLLGMGRAEDDAGGDVESEDPGLDGESEEATFAMALVEDCPLSCMKHEVRMALALQLRRWRRVADHDASHGFVGVAEGLLDALLSSLPAHCRVEEVAINAVLSDNYRTPKVLTMQAGPVRSRVLETIKSLPWRLTFQPLSKPACYVEMPQPAGSLIRLRYWNGFLRDLHGKVAPGKDYLSAVESLQAVGWRIDMGLLRVAIALAGLGYEKQDWSETTRELVATENLDETQIEACRKWSANYFYRPLGADEWRRREYSCPGEMLDHPAVKRVLETLGATDESGQTSVFYLPWMADYRGRLYPRTPWLTPQGGDFQRALFRFANAAPLTDAGVRALKQHGAALVSSNLLRTDLGLPSGQGISLAHRVAWVDQNEAQILACAESPLSQSFWRDVAEDDPFQFLSFCRAYAAWKADPQWLCDLPVQIDGSSNGLQHISALIGDGNLARAVNVFTATNDFSENAEPSDIYTAVAKAMCGSPEVDGDTEPKNAIDAFNRQARQLAKQCGMDSATWLDRQSVKKIVMTIPYGASPGTQCIKLIESRFGKIEQVFAGLEPSDWQSLEQLGAAVLALLQDPNEAKFVNMGGYARVHKVLRLQVRRVEKKHPLRELNGRVHGAWRQVNAKRQHCINSALAGIQGNASTALRRKIRQDCAKAHLCDDKAWHQWVGLSMVLYTVARDVVQQIRDSLNNMYPGVRKFESWLKGWTRRCAGMPLTWWSPVGFPVIQPGFVEKRTELTVRLSDQSDSQSVAVKYLTETSGDKAQASALLPNLIHSLDAAHLVRTLNGVVAKGIRDFGAIHDCVLCHPNEVATFKAVLTEQFAALYELGENGTPKVLNDWAAWMAVTANLRDTSEAWLLEPMINSEDLSPQGQALLALLRELPEEQQKLAKALLKYRASTHFRQPNNPAKQMPVATWIAEPEFKVGEVQRSIYFFH